MRFITGFEDAFLSLNQSKPPSKDFSQVIEALKYDLATAETAFARGAKKEFKRALESFKGGYSMRTSSECRGLYPFWFVEATVSIPASDLSSGLVLSELLSNFSDFLSNQVKDQHVILADPLHTKIVDLGKDPKDQHSVYQFRVKQKWTISRAEEKSS